MFKNKTFLIVILLFAINVYLVFAFYKALTHKRTVNIEGLTQIAELKQKTKDVKRKLNTSIVWDALEGSEALFLKDSILTLDNSEATIKLKSGDEIQLNPNSLIVLDMLKDSFSINFVKGNILTNTTSDNLKIKVNNQDIQLKKSLVSISGNNIAVVSGNVKIGEKEIQKGEIGKITKEGLTEVEKNIFQIEAPLPNQKFLTNTKTKDILFKWVSGGHKNAYALELSKDQDFEKILFAKPNIVLNQLAVKLTDGIYYYRLKSTVNGKEKISPVQNLSVIFEQPTKVIYPQQNALYKFKTLMPLIKFQWAGSAIQKRYVLEISKDLAFAAPIISKETIEPLLAINVEEGKFFARVKSYNSYRKEPSLSEVVNFSVQKLKELENPKLATPEDNLVIFKSLSKIDRIPFSWEEVPGSKKYVITISDDKDFKNIWEKKSGNFLTYSGKVTPNKKYYWSVQSVDEVDESAPIKTYRQLMVIDRPLINLISPKETEEIEIVSETEKEKVKFQWKSKEAEERNIAQSYEVYISKSGSFPKETTKVIISESNESLIELTEFGLYFWKVLEYSQGKEIFNTSRTQKFNLKLYPLLVSPLLQAPANNITGELVGNKKIVFKWQKLSQKDAKYEITILLENKPYLQNETLETSYTLVVKDLGKYTWFVKGIDKNKIKGKTSEIRSLTIIPEKKIAVPTDYKIEIK